MRTTNNWHRSVALAASLALVAVGCSGGSPSAESAPSTAAPPSSTAAVTTTSVTLPNRTPVTTVPPPTPPTEAQLRKIVDDFVEGASVPVSVIVRDLERGTAFEHEPDRQVLSASLYKLFVAEELLRQIGAGELDRAAPAGDSAGRNWDQCLQDMIRVSDDPCGVAGIDRLGRGAFDPALAAAGYPGTSLDNPQRTTAADVATLLTRVWDGSLLPDPGLTNELRSHLALQEVNDRLSLGLAPDTMFAHKTGDRTGWAHDAGIITTETGDYLVVVLTGPHPPPCCRAERPGPVEQLTFGAFANFASALTGVIGGPA